MVGPSLPFLIWNPGQFPSSFLFIVCIPFNAELAFTFTFISLQSFTVIYFGQWAAGFATFWYPGGSRNSRATLLPWHVFFGVYIYALAIATATTGILEKLTFLQTNRVVSRYSTEAVLVNCMGILIVVLGGFVILALVTPVNGKADITRGATE